MDRPTDVDDDQLPPERARAQRQREADLMALLGAKVLTPAELVKAAAERGLSARLSSNEFNSLQRIAQAGATVGLDKKHIARLVLLTLVVQKGHRILVTDLGKQRIAMAA